jgi:hypothetical protein
VKSTSLPSGSAIVVTHGASATDDPVGP